MKRGPQRRKEEPRRKFEDDNVFPCSHGFSQKDFADLRRVRHFGGSTSATAGSGYRTCTVRLSK